MKRFFLLTAIFLSACASNMQPIVGKEQIIDTPQLNTLATAELGETVLAYKVLNYKNSVRILADVSSNRGPKSIWTDFSVKKGIQRPMYEDSEFTQYLGGLCAPKDGGPWCGPYAEGKCGKQFCDLYVETEPAEWIDVNYPNFSQELIYNGRIDNFVKFLYRESSGGYMRDAFSQDVQYDLNNSSEIGFKGSRIEIIKATNTELQYRVLSPFRR